jgi:protein Tex
VKIDPKSLGVGQYQHDVDQKKLKAALDDVVISAVNQVGVDVNTASPYLLQYVSGMTLANAEKLVEYRAEHGAFNSRSALMHVPRMGAKTFEQAAGFLRIRAGENPLDNTAVHPESYALVKQIAKEQKTTISDLIGNETLIQRILDVSEVNFTTRDVLLELKKPGRDPRKQIRTLNFSQKIRTMSDLQIGMKLPGVVTNVTNFGAFVNIGIKENGLIHKSHLHEGYVENPADFISLHDHVEVEVVSIDSERKRIGLKRLA